MSASSIIGAHVWPDRFTVCIAAAAHRPRCSLHAAKSANPRARVSGAFVEAVRDHQATARLKHLAKSRLCDPGLRLCADHLRRVLDVFGPEWSEPFASSRWPSLVRRTANVSCVGRCCVVEKNSRKAIQYQVIELFDLPPRTYLLRSER